jgi:hypothetical protein
VVQQIKCGKVPGPAIIFSSGIGPAGGHASRRYRMVMPVWSILARGSDVQNAMLA